MWTGSVFMGSQRDPMDVIFDTGSDWLTIEGYACASCEGNTYDIRESTEAEQLADVTSDRAYGAAIMTGREFADTVCLTNDACLNDFEFFLIEYQAGLQEPVDGILGLARNKPLYCN